MIGIGRHISFKKMGYFVFRDLSFPSEVYKLQPGFVNFPLLLTLLNVLVLGLRFKNPAVKKYLLY